MPRPKKGCPRLIPIPQITMHIQRRDYDSIVYSREYQNQPFHEILHKILAKLDHLEIEVKNIRLEMSEYRNFIKMKGLEEELAKIFSEDTVDTDAVPAPTESIREYMGVNNQYPSWDL